MKFILYTAIVLLLFGVNTNAQKLGNAQAREIVIDAKGNIWILGTDFGIYQFKKNTWVEHPSRTKSLRISMSGNGTLYTVGYDNKMYFAKNEKDWLTFSPKQTVKYVLADAKGQAYTIGLNDKIYKQAGTKWEEIVPDGKAKQLMLGIDARLYHIGFNQKIYVLADKKWQELPCPKAKQMAQDAFGKIWVIGLDDKIYYPAGKSFNWLVYPQTHRAKALVMSPDGLPIYVDYWSNAVIKGKVAVR